MLDGAGLKLSRDGYFARGPGRFVPVGVNYWPASAGVEMWARWPEAEIRRDLDLLLRLGLNSIRFFLRWEDFEPQVGHYDSVMFQRLGTLLQWCRQRGLYAQPSLFIGWMSGGVFWPRWRMGRNIYANPVMVERAAAFAQRATEMIAPFHGSLLGVDLGNELCCLPDAAEASPEAVFNWCEAVTRAVRRAYPRALIVSGNDQNQITSDTGWRLGDQPGVDYYSMHGYPVPAWHSIGFDGMTDPLCQSLLPFYVQCARTYGPVMLQEFGTIITFGREQQDRYLRAVLPACWEAGANGFLWWCLRDIHAPVQPYLKNNFEGSLGLVDADDRVKPGVEYLLEFARSLPSRPAPQPDRATVGVYWPKHYYPRDNPENPGNDPRLMSRAMLAANHLLRQLGEDVAVVRGDRPLPPNLPALVVPGALLGADEAEALTDWVLAGGRLIWHGPDPVNWGYPYARLLGARPVDYRAVRGVSVDLFGETWQLPYHPRDMRVQLAVDSARVLAYDSGGLPAVLAHALGRGLVLYTTPLVEEAIASVAREPRERDRWHRWYQGMLRLAP